jgi:hypothetical protein
MLGHDVLCFSTDYPHWDNDMLDSTLRMLAPSARKAVFPARWYTASTTFCYRNQKRTHRRRRRAGREAVRSAATFRSPANAGCSTESSAWSE